MEERSVRMVALSPGPKYTIARSLFLPSHNHILSQHPSGLTTIRIVCLSGAGHHPDLLLLSVLASLLQSVLSGLATLGLAFLTASLLCSFDCDLDFDLRAFRHQHLPYILPGPQLRAPYLPLLPSPFSRQHDGVYSGSSFRNLACRNPQPCLQVSGRGCSTILLRNPGPASGRSLHSGWCFLTTSTCERCQCRYWRVPLPACFHLHPTSHRISANLA